MSTVYVRFDVRSGADRQRSATLESLLARADAVANIGDWRADAWQRIGGGGAMPPIAPAVFVASFGQSAAVAMSGVGSIFLATPVHYVADMTKVRMSDDLPALSPEEAHTTASEFNRIWNDGAVQLVADHGGRLFCTFSHVIDAATRDPGEAFGAPIDEYLPLGMDAKRLRLLMSEIEMWLFDAPLNRARRARGATGVSGLWLWGGGAPVHTPCAYTAAEYSRWSAGADVFFHAVAATAAATPEPRLFEHSGVVVVAGQPGGEMWREFEQRWMPPALASLKVGKSMWLDLSAGARRFSVNAAWRRRFWRRPRPWWEYFE